LGVLTTSICYYLWKQMPRLMLVTSHLHKLF